ncbi:MAG: putative rane protein, partial [Kribbellaceae bacterium]|nr:putative rane protein [Kribbellaceae bacterium]
MTSIRMAMSELRRLTAGRLPKLAVIAMILVPTLYGGLYLYANHDPYGRLDKVPTAVVVEDAGTTLSTGEKLSVGPQVADELVKSKSFDWHRVDRAEAQAGVGNGKYEFALVLPKSFSADLASSAEFEPRQANLELLTNDANNYLAHTIANQVVAQVTKSVAAQVSETAASKLLAGFSTIHGQIIKAADGAGQLKSGLTTAATGVGKLQTGAGQLNTAQQQLSAGATKLSNGLTTASNGAGDLANGAGQLSSGLTMLKNKTASLPADTKKLATGADQVADGNEKIAGVGQQVATASSTLVSDLSSLDKGLAARLQARGFTQTQINQVLTETAKLRGPVVAANTKIQSTSKQLNQLASGARQVATGAQTLANATPALTAGIKSAATGASQLNTGAGQLKTGIGSLQSGAAQLAAGEQQAVTGQGQLLTGVNSLATGVGKLQTGAGQLNTALTNGAKQIPDPSPEARKAVAETLGAPVGLKNDSQATADSYGAGLAPFFLSLSCWIGAYVLFLLVRPLSPRALAGLQAPIRVALGGWL